MARYDGLVGNEVSTAVSDNISLVPRAMSVYEVNATLVDQEMRQRTDVVVWHPFVAPVHTKYS